MLSATSLLARDDHVDVTKQDSIHLLDYPQIHDTNTDVNTDILKVLHILICKKKLSNYATLKSPADDENGIGLLWNVRLQEYQVCYP